MSIINEFIDALAIEIGSLQRGRHGNIVIVYNGELIRQTQDLFIYQFNLENFLIALDDTPAKIEVDGVDYEGDIISITGQLVQILLKQKISDLIPIARIKTNTWYLLERLKKKYEDNLNNQSCFVNSNKLFQDINSKIDGGGFNTSYSINDQSPNPSQHKAIESSINDFLSIIWGPPGTGKTATIAWAIESHLNLGRKVLLLSHSNNAVDQALTKVAAQMKSSYYNLGQLVRLGTPKEDMLKKIEIDCPLVLMYEIAEFKSKELIIEKKDLTKNLEFIRSAKLSFDNIIFLNNEISKINSLMGNHSEEIKKQESKIISASAEISQLQNRIEEQKDKLNRANNAGFLKRLFLGLNPVEIESNLKAINSNLFIKNNGLENFQEQHNQLNINIKLLQLEQIKKEYEFSKQLLKAGKSLSEVQQEIYDFYGKVKRIQLRLDEIHKAVEEIKNQILKESKLVATTLTRSYISKEIEDIEFDILIVDEVSMAPMPMLYWAASKAKKGITIVGDFKQLPPICDSKEELAKKWLGRSIFDELNISEISKAEERVQLLDEQFRMHPDISEIVNKYIYDNRLKDSEKVKNRKAKTDDVSGDSALCIIDTTLHNPWCSQFESGGRFNLISALICVSLAEKISKSFSKDESIGIITPYRHQARLILKIAEDKGIPMHKIRVNTVHSFQGGEETAIIFDSIEGEGARRWSMINEYNNNESALLLNVAFTRAKMKLYVVANYNYINRTFEGNTLFMDVLRHINAKGKVVKSTEIISDLKDENFEHWISELNSLKNRPENFGLSYTDQEFWPAFHNDLAKAEKELIIFSPFLTTDRLSKLHLIFSELIFKGVNIFVITLAPHEQPAIMQQGSREAMTKLIELGVKVKFRLAMHEKIALIDRKVKWVGSLNIMSHNSRKEYMERIEGESASKELFDKFKLNDLLMSQNINGETCPKCNNNFIAVRSNRQNRNYFYSCSGYPECDFIADIRTKSLTN